MAQVGGAIRRGPRQIELRVPLTSSTDIAFGLVVRKPRRRRRKRGALRRWTAAVTSAACCVIAAVIPIWTVIAAPELERLRAPGLAEAQPPPLAARRSGRPARALGGP